nr:unnamed protein product [Haemonchus contortus]
MVDINLEFPQFPKSFSDFSIKPDEVEVNGNNWETSLTLQNTSQCGILFKATYATTMLDECRMRGASQKGLN